MQQHECSTYIRRSRSHAHGEVLARYEKSSKACIEDINNVNFQWQDCLSTFNQNTESVGSELVKLEKKVTDVLGDSVEVVKSNMAAAKQLTKGWKEGLTSMETTCVSLADKMVDLGQTTTSSVKESLSLVATDRQNTKIMMDKINMELGCWYKLKEKALTHHGDEIISNLNVAKDKFEATMVEKVGNTLSNVESKMGDKMDSLAKGVEKGVLMLIEASKDNIRTTSKSIGDVSKISVRSLKASYERSNQEQIKSNEAAATLYYQRLVDQASEVVGIMRSKGRG